MGLENKILIAREQERTVSPHVLLLIVISIPENTPSNYVPEAISGKVWKDILDPCLVEFSSFRFCRKYTVFSRTFVSWLLLRKFLL